MSLCSWRAQSGSNALECAYCNRRKAYATVAKDPVGESDGCTAAWFGLKPEHVFVEFDSGTIECWGCGGVYPPALQLPTAACPRSAPAVIAPKHPFLPKAPPPTSPLAQAVANVRAMIPPTGVTPGWSLPAPVVAVRFCDWKFYAGPMVFRCRQCPQEVSYELYTQVVSQYGHPPQFTCRESLPKGGGRSCSACGREWCEVLDAYYGTDPVEARKCVKCRSKRVKAA